MKLVISGCQRRMTMTTHLAQGRHAPICNWKLLCEQ